MTLQFTVLFGCVPAMFALAAAPAQAQEKFPSRPIEMIIPTPPGGGVDITGRMLAEAAEPILGVKLVVVNVPGASGGVGVARMTAARPDGYTIAYVWNAPITIAPHTLDVPYGPDGIAPISQITGGTPLIFCVRPDFPATTGKDLIEHLRQNPNKYTYGTDGVGAIVQLSGERIFQQLGIKLRPVPFAGAAETLRNFLGAQIDIYGGSVPVIGAYMKDGKAKCLLATTRTRNPSAPDALSAGDLGVPDRATELWRGAIAPKDVPADRLKILEDALRKAAGAKAFGDYVQKSGEIVVAGTSDEFRNLIRAEHADFGAVAKAIGLGKK